MGITVAPPPTAEAFVARVCIARVKTVICTTHIRGERDPPSVFSLNRSACVPSIFRPHLLSSPARVTPYPELSFSDFRDSPPDCHLDHLDLRNYRTPSPGFPVFLGRCDPAAQEVCIQSLANAALDPRVSRRCRRRLGRALAAVCVAATTGVPPADSGSPAGGPTAYAAAPLLLPRARAGLFQACLSRLRGEQLDGDSSGDSSIRASGGGGGGGGTGGACALDLLRALPSRRSFSGINGGGDDDEELTAASVSFARTWATTADLLRNEAARRGGGEPSPGSSLRQREEEDNLVAGARFLAACPQQERKPAAGAEVDMGGGEAGGGLGAAAREVARELGGMLASSGLSGGLSERALSAITRRARVLPGVASRW